MQATVVHVAVVFFSFSYCFVNVFVTFWGLWQKTELPTWTWSQGHVNTDICFKPRVDSLTFFAPNFCFPCSCHPVYFTTHLTMLAWRPRPIYDQTPQCVWFKFTRRYFAAVLYSFHPSFDLPFAISSREKKTPLWFSPWETCKTEFINTYHLEKLLPAAQIEKLRPKLKGFVRIAENFLWGCCDHASKKKKRGKNSPTQIK